MQTLIQVYCTRGPSLRERIADSARLGRHRLEVTREHTPGRSPGWMKVHSTEPGRPGAMNIEWDRHSRLLTCRVITKGGNRPNLIISDFIDYLLAHHRRRIEAISIRPR